MLYPKNERNELDVSLFRDPTSEYRGAPFWAWNCKLDKDVLLTEIEKLKEMGMGGFHIHSRTGMATEYLSEEFMELVKACKKKAEVEEMLCWLYDEDRWPSGAAGGYVTKEYKYRARHMLFTPERKHGFADTFNQFSESGESYAGYLLTAFKLEICDGVLKSFDRLDPIVDGENIWYVYVELMEPTPWYNNQTYVNTLDPKAISRFIEITHEKYLEQVGDGFGGVIPAIFTDEPQFTRKEHLNFADDRRDVKLPYADDFPLTFLETYGYNIIDKLPELIWELPDGAVSVARYHFHDHICERFTGAFADQVGKWCNEHGIMLTGHMMEEHSLEAQTGALGEAMRSYRSFGLPGIDILCDRREFGTAKQAQSAAHQYGAPGVLSELYGVTNWDFDFKGHKLQGDWQAALGVTTRVHHLTWVSMGGEAKRDYPACIGYQSPWYKEYPYIENHFARLNTALTRGTPSVKVGVIHPIESYWLHWGPNEQTFDQRNKLEEGFNSFIEWMLYGLVDFDFISESLLPSQNTSSDNAVFEVGKMKYDTIIVPGLETIRATTLERLEAFKRAGGKIIVMGGAPKYVDAEPNGKAAELFDECININSVKHELLSSLRDERFIDILTGVGKRTDNMIYQLREDGEGLWLFICHVNDKKNWLDAPEPITISLKGTYKPTLYNTLTGETSNCLFSINGSITEIKYEIFAHDSLLLYLEPITTNEHYVDGTGINRLVCESAHNNVAEGETVLVCDPVPVSLSEPNVLVLDMAKYAFDDSGYSDGVEEVLRIDNMFRKRIGYKPRESHIAQPWVSELCSEDEHTSHSLRLQFDIYSEIDVKAPKLALENYENSTIVLNGERVILKPDGYFTDLSISTVELPDIKMGKNVLELTIKYDRNTNVEWCYLLGDFGVKLRGRHVMITRPTNELAFGDFTHQGLPFYAGNVTYHCPCPVHISGKREVTLEIPRFSAPLIRVDLLDESGKVLKSEAVAFAPHRVYFGELAEGTYKLDITLFGNRVNAFGQLHLANSEFIWYGPQSWRTLGTDWAYQYNIKPMGIMNDVKMYVSADVNK